MWKFDLESDRSTAWGGIGGPMAAPTIVAAGAEDVPLSSDEAGGGTDSFGLDAVTPVGRISWREIEP